jgi:hypothetical protein
MTNSHHGDSYAAFRFILPAAGLRIGIKVFEGGDVPFFCEGGVNPVNLLFFEGLWFLSWNVPVKPISPALAFGSFQRRRHPPCPNPGKQSRFRLPA